MTVPVVSSLFPACLLAGPFCFCCNLWLPLAQLLFIGITPGVLGRRDFGKAEGYDLDLPHNNCDRRPSSYFLRGLAIIPIWHCVLASRVYAEAVPAAIRPSEPALSSHPATRSALLRPPETSMAPCLFHLAVAAPTHNDLQRLIRP